MKKKICSLVMMAFMAVPSFSQTGWFYGVNALSSNWYTGIGVNLIEGVVNALIGQPHTEFYLGLKYASMKDNGEKADFKYGDPYGFTAFDLFNDMEFGLKFGYLSPTSPIGVYAKVNYGFKQFKTKFPYETDFQKNKVQSFIPGLGVRIQPFADGDEGGVFAEIQTSYVKRIKYDGYNGNDLDQVNNGMRTAYSLGWAGKNDVVQVGFEMDNFDFFNKSYSPDGGITHPYENIKTKNYYFYIQYTYTFGD